MGRAIIGGVITSTLLTLVVVPVLYTYLDAWHERLRGRRAAKAAAAGGAAVANPAPTQGTSSSQFRRDGCLPAGRRRRGVAAERRAIMPPRIWTHRDTSRTRH